MALWNELETITKTLEIVNHRNGKLQREDPLVKLTRIQDNLFSGEVGYTDVCYILDIANAIDVITPLARRDFSGGVRMNQAITVDRVLDTIIPRVKEIKEGTK